MKYFWKMRDGQLIDVDQMSETHLRNSLKMMIRNSRTCNSPRVDIYFKKPCLLEEDGLT
jgi:hypothetical protein